MEEFESQMIRMPVEVRQEHQGMRIVGYGRTIELEDEGLVLRIDQRLSTSSPAYVTFKPPSIKPVTVTTSPLWVEKAGEQAFDAGLRITSQVDIYQRMLKFLVEKQGEKRRAQRYRQRVEINYSSQEKFYREYTANISSGGLYVHSDNPPSELEEVEYELRVPGLDQPIHGLAKVVFVNPPQNAISTGLAPGFGMEFLKFQKDDDLRFFLFLDRLKDFYSPKRVRARRGTDHHNS